MTLAADKTAKFDVDELLSAQKGARCFWSPRERFSGPSVPPMSGFSAGFGAIRPVVVSK